MSQIYKDKKVVILNFIFSLFAINAMANNHLNFDEEPIVYQNANFQSVANNPSKAVIDASDRGGEQQLPVVVMIGPEEERPQNVITKAHRTKVFTPRIGPIAISGQEAKTILDNTLDNNQENESKELESTDGQGEEVFETIGYTRDILNRDVVSEILVEVG